MGTLLGCIGKRRKWPYTATLNGINFLMAYRVFANVLQSSSSGRSIESPCFNWFFECACSIWANFVSIFFNCIRVRKKSRIGFMWSECEPRMASQQVWNGLDFEFKFSCWGPLGLLVDRHQSNASHGMKVLPDFHLAPLIFQLTALMGP